VGKIERSITHYLNIKNVRGSDENRNKKGEIMKTYEINNQSELEQFKDEYGYKVKGNLDVKCSLDIKKRLARIMLKVS